jgi:ATP adenylyltransferase
MGGEGEYEVQRGAGAVDNFRRLWTPHRMAYIRGEGRPAEEECPFCTAPTLPDQEGLVVARGQVVYAVLNLYPYNSGHLMVLPYRHVADYVDLTDEEVKELADFTRHAMRTIRHASGAQGFNIGMNQGSAAGAGIAAHLHQHVVPRWGGDTNFMPVVGHTKVLPQLLGETWGLLTRAWGEVTAAAPEAVGEAGRTGREERDG